MIADSTFFAIAATHSKAKPKDRFDAVAHLIRDLEDVADRALRNDADRSTQASHEVAATRAELYMWIAYNNERLFAPFDDGPIAKAAAVTCPNDGIRADGTIGVEAVQLCADWQALDGDALGAWATQQAAAVYNWQKWDGFDFALNFGQAECGFALGTWMENTTNLIEAYREAERRASEQLGMRREQRKSVEFAQLWLISSARLVWLLRYDRSDQVPMAESELRQAQRLVQDKLGDIRGAAKLTIFSALQRRALSIKEFKQEAEELVNQALRS
jgi:hypothetical protein